MAILGGSGISVTDVSDALVTTDGLPPRGASNGTLWLDGKTLKKYENGNWVIQEIDVTKLDPDLTKKIEGIMDNLGTIGDDSKLTFNDRSILARELGEIIGVIPSKSTGNVYPSSLPAYNVLDSSGSGTFSNVRTRAVTVGMDVNDSRYKAVETAYTSLNSYLSQYTPKAWDITTANKDKVVTLTDPDMFRQKFLDYYTAELKLATEVERVAKESAEEYVEELTDGVSLKDKTDILSGNPIFTDKADDAVVHVEVDGKSVGGNDSSKNLAPNLEHWAKGYGTTVQDDTVTIPVGGTFKVDIPWDGSTNNVRVGYDVVKGSSILVNFTYLASDKTTRVQDKDGLGTGNGYTSALTAGTRGQAMGYYTIDSNTKYVRVLISGSSAYVNEPFTLKNISVRSDSYDYEPPAPTPDYPIAINSFADRNVLDTTGAHLNCWLTGVEVYPNPTQNALNNSTARKLIKVTSGETLSLVKDASPVGADNYWRLSWLNQDFNYVTRTTDRSNNSTVTVPANVSYLWVSYPNGTNPRVYRGTDTSPAGFDVVSSVGKENLLPSSNFEYSNHGWIAVNSPAVRENGILTVNADGTNVGATRFQSEILIKESGSYTIQALIKTNTDVQFRGFVEAEAENNVLRSTNGEWEVLTAKFYVPVPNKIVTIRLYLGDGSSGKYASMDWVKLEKGSDVTPWTESLEDIQPDTPNPTTYKTNISLPEPLRSVGDIKDRLFRDSDGLWKVERNVGEFEWNTNSKNVSLHANMTDTSSFRIYTLDAKRFDSFKDKVIFSHGIYSRGAYANNGFIGLTTWSGQLETQNTFMLCLPNSVADTVDKFKTWMDAQNPVFLYSLGKDSVTIETLPDDLQQKLNNIQSYKGSNYVYTVLPDKSDTLSPNLRATFKSRGWYREFSNEAWKVESEKALENLDKEIGDVDKVAQALKNFTDTAFADGIIQMAEAQAISEHLNTLKKENDDLSNQYTTIYGNSNLLGTPKTNLASAKTAYNTAYTSLTNSINTAISGNKTTTTQKADVDNKFTAYSTALKLLNQRLNEALSAIADKIATDVATAKANVAKTEASAYADGIVTAEEKRAIADAKAKLAEAQKYADSAVGNVAVGVGNLLKDSRINVTTSSYLMHTIALTESIKDGTEVTILLKGQLGVGKQYFGIYNSGGTVMLQGLNPTMQDANGIYKATFNWRVGGMSNTAIHIYAIANTVTVNSTIEWVKLVYGNKTSPTWEPSIADQEKDLHDATRLPVRYIRDWSAGSDMNSSSHWVEIQAIQNGVNVAKGTTVTSSSDVTSASVIVDGNTATGSYASMSNAIETVPDPSTGGTKTVVTPGYVIIDLKKVYNDLEAIKIWHYYADERTYNNTLTEVSVDGENWTALYDSEIMGVYPETSQGRTYSVITNQLASNAIQHTTNLVSRVNNVEQQITADAIVSTVMAQEKFTSWQEVVDAKPTPEAFDLLSGNLSSTTDAVSTIETRVTEVEQTANSWGVTLDEQQEIINEHGTTVSNVTTYMTFKDTGLEIGKSDSNMKVNISNTQIDFMDNGLSVAWINGQQLYIRNAQVLNTLVVGNHKFEKLGTDMTVVNWFGG